MKSYKKSVSMSISPDELYSEYKNRIMGKARYLRSQDIDVREYSILLEDKYPETEKLEKKCEEYEII